jgi:hypothetical protein
VEKGLWKIMNAELCALRFELSAPNSPLSAPNSPLSTPCNLRAKKFVQFAQFVDKNPRTKKIAQFVQFMDKKTYFWGSVMPTIR